MYLFVPAQCVDNDQAGAGFKAPPWILAGLKRQSLNHHHPSGEGGWSDDDGEEIVLFYDNEDAFVYFRLSLLYMDLYERVLPVYSVIGRATRKVCDLIMKERKKYKNVRI